MATLNKRARERLQKIAMYDKLKKEIENKNLKKH